MRENWLTTRDAAEQMEVSTGTVRAYIKRGLLNAVKTGGLWEIDPASIRDFLRQFKAERLAQED